MHDILRQLHKKGLNVVPIAMDSKTPLISNFYDSKLPLNTLLTYASKTINFAITADTIQALDVDIDNAQAGKEFALFIKHHLFKDKDFLVRTRKEKGCPGRFLIPCIYKSELYNSEKYEKDKQSISFEVKAGRSMWTPFSKRHKWIQDKSIANYDTYPELTNQDIDKLAHKLQDIAKKYGLNKVKNSILLDTSFTTPAPTKKEVEEKVKSYKDVPFNKITYEIRKYIKNYQDEDFEFSLIYKLVAIILFHGKLCDKVERSHKLCHELCKAFFKGDYSKDMVNDFIHTKYNVNCKNPATITTVIKLNNDYKKKIREQQENAIAKDNRSIKDILYNDYFFVETTGKAYKVYDPDEETAVTTLKQLYTADLVNDWLSVSKKGGKKVDNINWNPNKPYGVNHKMSLIGNRKITYFNAFSLPEHDMTNINNKDIQDKVSILLGHIAYVMGTEERGAWFEQFLAHIIQRPYERGSNVVLNICKNQGVGRGLLGHMIQRLIGTHNYINKNLSTLTGSQGQFNASYSRKLVLMLGESSDPTTSNNAEIHKQKALYEMFKTLATDNIEVIGKGTDGIQQDDVVFRMLICSNHLDAVRFDKNDRRFVVFYNENEKTSSKAGGYIRSCINNDTVIASLYNYLENLDISNYDVNNGCDDDKEFVYDQFNSGLGGEIEIELKTNDHKVIKPEWFVRDMNLTNEPNALARVRAILTKELKYITVRKYHNGIRHYLWVRDKRVSDQDIKEYINYNS